MKKHVLQWHITHKCNLRCSHCYQEEYCNDLPYIQLENIFNQYLDFLKKNNFKGHINFTGGEPFIYPDIFKLFDLCEKNNISFGVLTNGTLITENEINKIKKYNKLSFIQISIDGVESTYDNIRGKGNFKKSFNTLKLLRKNNIQTMVAFTCHKGNFSELKDVIKIVKKNKIDRFWVDRLIPIGNNKEDILDTLQYKEVIKILTAESKKAKTNPFCKTTIHTNRALQFCEGGNEIYQCSAGISLLTILANGDLLPCRRLPIRIGNLLENNLVELYENSNIIKELNLKTIPKDCSSCLMARYCRGGAKCLTYALTGSYNKKDINCYK